MNWILKAEGSYVGIIISNILVCKVRKSPGESKSHSQKSKYHLGILNIIMPFESVFWKAI